MIYFDSLLNINVQTSPIKLLKSSIKIIGNPPKYHVYFISSRASLQITKNFFTKIANFGVKKFSQRFFDFFFSLARIKVFSYRGFPVGRTGCTVYLFLSSRFIESIYLSLCPSDIRTLGLKPYAFSKTLFSQF